MALTCSADSPAALDAAARARLIAAARAAIGDGVAGREPLPPRLDDHPPVLRAPGATFVTLDHGGTLRGCVGTLEACRPLVVDAAWNAYAAAFRDPRFPALTCAELERIDVCVSILSPPEPLRFRSEEELLEQLRPGVDGLILSEGERQGTFLPAVWTSVTDRRAFLLHLKLKAGLPADYWSDTIKVSRYTTFSIP